MLIDLKIFNFTLPVNFNSLPTDFSNANNIHYYIIGVLTGTPGALDRDPRKSFFVVNLNYWTCLLIPFFSVENGYATNYDDADGAVSQSPATSMYFYFWSSEQ